jgi:hypothetical protein
LVIKPQALPFLGSIVDILGKNSIKTVRMRLKKPGQWLNDIGLQQENGNFAIIHAVSQDVYSKVHSLVNGNTLLKRPISRATKDE